MFLICATEMLILQWKSYDDERGNRRLLASFLALCRVDLCTFNVRTKYVTNTMLWVMFRVLFVCSHPRSPRCRAVPSLLLHLLPCHFPPRFQGRSQLPWRAASLKLQPFLWQPSVDNRFFPLHLLIFKLRCQTVDHYLLNVNSVLGTALSKKLNRHSYLQEEDGRFEREVATVNKTDMHSGLSFSQ